MTGIDLAFEAARAGDAQVFAVWMGRVERPIRAALRPYALAVDVEGVLQETLLRMWLLCIRVPPRELAGEDASLRFAIGMARNLARSEARRFGREWALPPEELPEIPVAPDPPSDPGLARAIAECMKRLARRPLAALMARLGSAGTEADDRLARRVRMTLDTFHQNLVRARRQMAECLTRRGVDLGEILG